MRRRKAEKREANADAKYESPVIGKFINIITLDGEKSVANRVLYDALDIVGEKTNEEPLKVFFDAINNARPRLEVRPRRIGGATYQVPTEVTKERGVSIVLRWFRDFARSKKGKPMSVKLAEEILAAYKNEGAIVKKRDDTHKMAEANRAFAHFKF